MPKLFVVFLALKYAEPYYYRGLASGSTGNDEQAIHDIKIATRLDYQLAQEFEINKNIQKRPGDFSLPAFFDYLFFEPPPGWLASCSSKDLLFYVISDYTISKHFQFYPVVIAEFLCKS